MSDEPHDLILDLVLSREAVVVMEACADTLLTAAAVAVPRDVRDPIVIRELARAALDRVYERSESEAHERRHERRNGS